MSHTHAPVTPAGSSHGGGHTHGDGTHHGGSPGGGEVGIGTPAASASVALDIGGGLGALVISPSERFRSHEIEISRVDHDGPRVHTGVHERASEAGSALTAIFGSLAAGRYVIWEDASTAGPEVDVPDGAVAQIRLS
jgi:hypothetical protein